MKRFVRAIAPLLGCVFLATGCGGGGGKTPILAPVGGSVTYSGGPVAGAIVTFVPDNGPLAMAETNLNGEFTLKSGALPGCAVGPVKVAVRVPSAGDSTPMGNPDPFANAKTQKEMMEASTKMGEMTLAKQGKADKPKSLIPEKYHDIKTSGLSYTVDKDGAKNNFKIELTD
jgi:hypothetical protein